MLKKRLLLAGICALVIWLLFQLPKAVVENESNLTGESSDTVSSHIESHVQTPQGTRAAIQRLRQKFAAGTEKEKNAIFADSLANLYRAANQYDSAAWFAEESAKFFNTVEKWIAAGDNYYQAYTIAIDRDKQQFFAQKTQEFYAKVLQQDADNLTVKANLAMTYLTGNSPMQGIAMLREVLARDPRNELALFNMGVLSIQSGQYDRAIERLLELIKVNPGHIQGHLLLGLSYMNAGDKAKAREYFEKVKLMDKDPAVQATADSYLKDLK